MEKIKISKLTKDEYKEIKEFEQIIEDRMQEHDKGTQMHLYYLLMSYSSTMIKDYSREK